MARLRRLARAVAGRLLPAPDREFILGDLEELQLKWARDGNRATAMARYLGALLASARAQRAPWLSGLGPHRPEDDSGSPSGERRHGIRGRFDSMAQDVRFGMRSLLRDPLFTTVAVGCLALGIGATTAIFSLVNGVLLRALPYSNPDELVFVREYTLERGAPPSGDPNGWASYLSALAWRESAETLGDLSVAGFGTFLVLGGDAPEAVEGAPVSANYFHLLGTPAANGRVFAPGETGAVVVLSDRLWRQSFGGAPDVVGRTVRIGGRAFEVVGVMPADFSLPYTREQFWIPFEAMPREWRLTLTQGREVLPLRTVARLVPGATVADAEAELGVIAERLRGEYPGVNIGRRVQVVPLHETRVGRVRPTLLMLFGAVGLLLLIACANVANLLLARVTARQGEVAIRAALGAGRWRIARQLLTESTLLSLAGGVLGSLIALWAVRIIKVTSPGDIPRLHEVGVDGSVLLFTFLLSLAVGWGFGLAPAMQAARSHTGAALQRRSPLHPLHGGAGSGARLRSALVVAEAAIALVLMIGAGLLISSFRYLWTYEPGFDASGVLTVDIPLEDAKYPELVHKDAFYQQLYERLRGLPSVESVGGVTRLPGESPGLYVGFDRPEHLPPVEHYHLPFRLVSGDFFATLRIPLLAGRLFRPDDVDVAVINEAMAKEIWPREAAVGKELALDTRDLRVVGVVGDQRASGTSPEPQPEMFVPHTTGFGNRGLVVVVRTGGDPRRLAATIREHVAALDPEQPIAGIRTMEEFVEETMARPRFYMAMFSLFGGLALALSAVGIFGVASHSVTQRTHEVGVRIALGAERRHVLRLIVGRGAILTGAGVVIGLVAARALTRHVESLLYGVAPNDPATFLTVPLVLVAAALLAFWLPARRAADVDPIVALRGE